MNTGFTTGSALEIRRRCFNWEMLMKPKLSYAEFEAVQKKETTVAALIFRFIAEMPSVRPLGLSHRLTLEKIARSWLGQIEGAALTKINIQDYCKERKDICPATRGQYITYLAGVLKYASSAWADCAVISARPIDDAKAFLKKNGFIGKSTPRERRPTADEIERLLALFAEQNKRPKNDIDMALLARWQIASSRRIGETCALLWGDWDRENHTILVRKMKDPKNKNKQKVVALPADAQAMLIELEPLRKAPGNPAERIFPYNSHSVSARYTEAKKELGIVNLRLHDSRREAASRLIEDGFSAEEVIGFTGHETTAVLQRTYMRPKPERLKNGPASKRAASQ